MENFYAAISLCRELYGVELDSDTFETYALTAWNKIGNKQTRKYKIKVCPICDPEGGSYIEKPCNLIEIEAITLKYEDAREITANRNFAGYINHPVEQYIEAFKRNTNTLYPSGKFIDYYELGDKIYFNRIYPSVYILYKGIYADEEGLPYLNDKEVFAIATYCAYAHYFKKGLMTKDSGTIQLAQVLKADWKRACDAARVDKYISQNHMNEILDVMTSWDRKTYNISYKGIK